jgi:hypothetical protein
MGPLPCSDTVSDLATHPLDGGYMDYKLGFGLGRRFPERQGS